MVHVNYGDTYPTDVSKEMAAVGLKFPEGITVESWDYYTYVSDSNLSIVSHNTSTAAVKAVFPNIYYAYAAQEAAQIESAILRESSPSALLTAETQAKIDQELGKIRTLMMNFYPVFKPYTLAEFIMPDNTSIMKRVSIGAKPTPPDISKYAVNGIPAVWDKEIAVARTGIYEKYRCLQPVEVLYKDGDTILKREYLGQNGQPHPPSITADKTVDGVLREFDGWNLPDGTFANMRSTSGVLVSGAYIPLLDLKLFPQGTKQLEYKASYRVKNIPPTLEFATNEWLAIHYPNIKLDYAKLSYDVTSSWPNYTLSVVEVGRPIAPVNFTCTDGVKYYTVDYWKSASLVNGVELRLKTGSDVVPDFSGKLRFVPVLKESSDVIYTLNVNVVNDSKLFTFSGKKGDQLGWESMLQAFKAAYKPSPHFGVGNITQVDDAYKINFPYVFGSEKNSSGLILRYVGKTPRFAIDTRRLSTLTLDAQDGLINGKSTLTQSGMAGDALTPELMQKASKASTLSDTYPFKGWSLYPEGYQILNGQKVAQIYPSISSLPVPPEGLDSVTYYAIYEQKNIFHQLTFVNDTVTTKEWPSPQQIATVRGGTNIWFPDIRFTAYNSIYTLKYWEGKDSAGKLYQLPAGAHFYDFAQDMTFTAVFNIEAINTTTTTASTTSSPSSSTTTTTSATTATSPTTATTATTATTGTTTSTGTITPTTETSATTVAPTSSATTSIGPTTATPIHVVVLSAYSTDWSYQEYYDGDPTIQNKQYNIPEGSYLPDVLPIPFKPSDAQNSYTFSHWELSTDTNVKIYPDASTSPVPRFPIVTTDYQSSNYYAVYTATPLTTTSTTTSPTTSATTSTTTTTATTTTAAPTTTATTTTAATTSQGTISPTGAAIHVMYFYAYALDGSFAGYYDNNPGITGKQYNINEGVYLPDTLPSPNRPADANYTYTFSHWEYVNDKSIKIYPDVKTSPVPRFPITSSMDLYAVYKATPVSTTTTTPAPSLTAKSATARLLSPFALLCFSRPIRK